MNHLGTVRIETERLILRAASASDINNIYSKLTNDKEVMHFMNMNQHTNIQQTQKMVQRWETKSHEDPTFYCWVVDKKSEENKHDLIGSITIHAREGSIGYFFSRDSWGFGYATECVKAILSFAFEKVGFPIIKAYYIEENKASEKVMLKCGMKSSYVKDVTFEGHPTKLFCCEISRDDYLSKDIESK